MAKAEAIGLPEYQSRELRLSGCISMEQLEEKRQELEFACAEWEKTMSTAMGKTNRFALLSRSQLLYIIDFINKCSLDELFPYFRILFPEVSDEGTFLSAFQSSSERVLNFLRAADRHAIDGILLLITNLEEALDVRQYFDIKGPSGKGPTIVRCLNKSEEDLMRIVEMSLECIPMSSQILWGKSFVTRIDIERFLFAAKRMTQIDFAIVGVNELNVDCREYLLNELARVVYENDAVESFEGRLSLVFTSKVGIDAFQIFEESAIDQDIHGFTYENFADLGFERRFLPIEIVHGGPGSGKSTYIHNLFRTSNISRIATLTVHEDFTPRKFIDWYVTNVKKDERLADGQIVGIHVNITPYGNLDSLSRFLYSLTAFGLLEDEKTGCVAILLRNLRHQIVVELPALTDSSFSTLGDIKRHPYISKISVLHLLMQENCWHLINTTTVGVLIDDDYRVVAHYLQRYFAGEFSQPPQKILGVLPLLVSNNDLPDSVCMDQLTRLFNELAPSVPNTHMKRGIFIRLLADRFRFIPFMLQCIRDDRLFR